MNLSPNPHPNPNPSPNPNPNQARLKDAEEEARKAKELHAKQEAELQAMRDEIESMAKGNAPKASMAGMGSSGFKTVPEMLAVTAKKMARKAKGARRDPVALNRVISTLPVLSACNDLRALTEIEPTNRGLFQQLGGLNKMIDYLSPNGPNAPYATHIARTLPAVMDREGREIFSQCAARRPLPHPSPRSPPPRSCIFPPGPTAGTPPARTA